MSTDQDIETEAFKRAIQNYSETSDFEHRHGDLAEDRFVNIRDIHYENTTSDVQTRIPMNRIEFDEGEFVCDKYDLEGNFISTLKVKIKRFTKNTTTPTTTATSRGLLPYREDDLYNYSWRSLPGYPANGGRNDPQSLHVLQDDTWVKGLSREVHKLVHDHSRQENRKRWSGLSDASQSIKRRWDGTVKSRITRYDHSRG